MDLLDTTQKERAAVLDYSDAQALVSYHNYLRERQSLVPLAIETNLAKTLGVLYPQVIFKPDHYKVRAEVRSGVEGALIDQIGFVTNQTDFLETKISQNYDALHVIFRADGFGVIKEDSWFEFFDHELNLDEVRQECEGDADAIDDHLSDYFFNEVSETLEDPFFDPDGANNRRSGYSQSPECFTWQIGDVLEEASARERMAARRELRLYLEKRGHTLAKFDALAEAEKAA